MFDFYQSGDDALIMPRMRDLTSNLPSAEAYYRLGLVNSAQRYMFDIHVEYPQRKEKRSLYQAHRRVHAGERSL